MADTVYRVVLSLNTEGNLGAGVGNLSEKLGSAERRTHQLHHALATTGEVASRAFERVGHLIESVADKAIHIGEAMALVGGGGMFAAAAYGVTNLNRQLEETQISLGAIFQAQGFVSNFESGFKMAGDQVAKMKQDVKTLPGDLGQLSDMMKMIATPAAQGGLGADAIRKMAGQTMLVSTILGVQQDMAAREMANLLAGRAGAHNILGGRLGLIGEKAKEFNAESPQKRVAEIQELLGRYQGANDRFAQSFIANWTTLKDNIKYGFLADATAPLFDAVKRTMASINTWFDNNQEKVKSWASAFGTRIASAWSGMTGEAEKFGPALENLGHVFFELWDKGVEKARELEPFLLKVAGILERVSAKDVIDVGKDVLEMKLGGMGLGVAGHAIGAGVTGLRLIDAWQRVTGGGAQAASAAAGAEGAGALPAAAAGTSAALVGSAAFGAGVFGVGAAEAIHDFTQTVHGDKEKFDIVKDSQEKATAAVDHLGASLDANTAQGLMLQGALENLFIKVDRLNPTEPAAPIGQREDMATIASGMLHSSDALNHIATEQKKPKLPGGGGGTVMKVEIAIKGSDDPSRVARLTVEHLQRLARNPKQSPSVPDWAR